MSITTDGKPLLRVSTNEISKPQPDVSTIQKSKPE
jgi:hypothetical protein